MRSFLISAATLLLAACGFQPLHQATAPSSAVGTGPLAAMEIVSRSADDSEDRRAEYLTRRALEERIGSGGDPRYVLTVTPSVNRGGLGVGTNDVPTRFDYNIFVAYVVRDAKTGETEVDGQVYAVATYGVPRDPYARISAEVAAAEQAAADAADRIFTDLAVHFAKAETPET